MDVAGGTVFIRFGKAGIFDESVVREKDQQSLRGKFAETGGQVELQVLEDVNPADFLDPFLQAGAVGRIFFQNCLEKLHLPGSGGREMGP